MLSVNDRELRAPDGTRIAYAVEGEGPPLVLTNGLTTTTTFWKYLRPDWLRDYTVVTWDLPGHGNSGPARSDAIATIEAQPSLVAQVMRAAGVDRATQIGWSTGAQVVIETYRQRPELCERLVMVLGGAGHALTRSRLPLGGPTIDWLARNFPPPAFEATFRAIATGLRQPGALRVGQWLELFGPDVTAHDAAQITSHIATLHPYTLQRFMRSCETHDAYDVLPNVRVPLLILAGDVDPFAPTDLVGAPMHARAPGSTLVRLPRGTHTALVEEPHTIASAVKSFLARA